MPEQQRICDYEESSYRTDFWEGRGRDYEDVVERDVLRRLLPERGHRLLEIGAGFGRLSEEYDQYDRVVLMDYSFSQLQYARERLGDERYIYVAANVYKLPFRRGVFDTATMIRVIHHLEDVPKALHEIRNVLVSGGGFILEHANKRNLKAMFRYATRRQSWSPYDQQPIEFIELNYNFHPDYVIQELVSANLVPKRRFPVSFFRTETVKQRIPPRILATMDKVMQYTGWTITPSIFIKSIAKGNTDYNLNIEHDAIFACPETGRPLRREGDLMVSDQGFRWQVRDGIYDFKQPVT